MKRLLAGLLLIGLSVALLAPLGRRTALVEVDLGQYPARKAKRDEGALAAVRRLAAEAGKNSHARAFAVTWRTAVPPHQQYVSRVEYDRPMRRVVVKGIAGVAAAPAASVAWRTLYEYRSVTDDRLRHLAADGSPIEMLPRYGGERVS